MAVIDVFKLVFDSDASGMKKGSKEAQDATDKLKVSVLETDKASQDLGNSFLGMVSDAKGALAGLVGISGTVSGILGEAARVNALGNFSELIGQNIEDVDAWGQAVARQGGSAEGFQASLKGLTDTLTEIALTGGGAATGAFARLGIDAFDTSAFELLPEIASSFEDISKAETVALGQQIGLDSSLILLLQQGRLEVDALVRKQKELGVATAEDAEIAEEFNQQWMDTRQVFGGLFREIGVDVLPVLGDLFTGVRSFVDFVRDNETLVKGAFLGMALVLTATLGPALLAVLGPLGIPALIIGAFALMYDEIQNFLAGNDSLIGEISKEYPLLGDIVKSLADYFGDLGDNVGRMFTAIKEGNFIDYWLAEIKIFKEELEALFNFIQKKSGIGQRQVQVVSVGGDTGQENLPTFAQPQNRNIGSDRPLLAFDSLKAADEAMAAARNNAMTASGNRTITSAVNTTNKNTSMVLGDIKVNAAGGDSKEITANIRSELESQMKQVVSNFDDGVAG